MKSKSEMHPQPKASFRSSFWIQCRKAEQALHLHFGFQFDSMQCNSTVAGGYRETDWISQTQRQPGPAPVNRCTAGVNRETWAQSHKSELSAVSLDLVTTHPKHHHITSHRPRRPLKSTCTCIHSADVNQKTERIDHAQTRFCLLFCL